jgi:hypothetical protein
LEIPQSWNDLAYESLAEAINDCAALIKVKKQ